MPDLDETLTIAQAAKRLNRTAKRVRQMVQEGKLVAVAGSDVTRVRLADVDALARELETREARGQVQRTGPRPVAQGWTYEQVVEFVDRQTRLAIEATESANSRAIAAMEASEKMLRDALDQERAQRQMAEQEAEQLRQQLAAASQQVALPDAKRRWFGRK
jgi:excisionase family DNA binding protein